MKNIISLKDKLNIRYAKECGVDIESFKEHKFLERKIIKCKLSENIACKIREGDLCSDNIICCSRCTSKLYCYEMPEGTCPKRKNCTTGLCRNIRNSVENHKRSYYEAPTPQNSKSGGIIFLELWYKAYYLTEELKEISLLADNMLANMKVWTENNNYVYCFQETRWFRISTPQEGFKLGSHLTEKIRRLYKHKGFDYRNEITVKYVPTEKWYQH